MPPEKTQSKLNKPTAIDLTREPITLLRTQTKRTIALTRGQIRVQLQEDIQNTPSLRTQKRTKTASLRYHLFSTKTMQRHLVRSRPHHSNL